MIPDYLAAFEEYGKPGTTTVLLSLAGAICLDLMYKSIKTRWPEAYTSLSTDFDKQVRTNPVRSLFLFRGMPVFLISLFTAVMAERGGAYPWISAALLLAFYLASTTFKNIKNTIKLPRSSNWIVTLLYHCGATTAVVTVVILATALRTSLDPLIPPTKDILIALWAGLFATLFAAVARASLLPEKLDARGVVDQLKSDIGKENWDYAAVVAGTNLQFRNFIRAILLAEAQQRPRWFRRLERVKGLIYRPGTYGVAQVAAAKPISDKESIDLLAQRFSDYCFLYRLDYSWYRQLEYDLIRMHNSDQQHAQRVTEFLSILDRDTDYA